MWRLFLFLSAIPAKIGEETCRRRQVLSWPASNETGNQVFETYLILYFYRWALCAAFLSFPRCKWRSDIQKMAAAAASCYETTSEHEHETDWRVVCWCSRLSAPPPLRPRCFTPRAANYKSGLQLRPSLFHHLETRDKERKPKNVTYDYVGSAWAMLKAIGRVERMKEMWKSSSSVWCGQKLAYDLGVVRGFAFMVLHSSLKGEVRTA